MSTIQALVPYQIETFGRRFRHDQPRGRRGEPAGAAPARSGAFITQMILGSDDALRTKIGRRDLAEGREAAYSAALANRPSAHPRHIRADLGEA